MSNLDRELQARVQEQVESTARACQVSAEVVMEISKLGASILTGDEASPRTSYSNASAATQVMWEALVKNKYLTLQGSVLLFTMRPKPKCRL